MEKIVMSITERLKEIRTYHDLSQKYIGSILNITQSTYVSYETNRRIIPLKHLNTLANFYNVSTDYLLGLTNKSKNTEAIKLDAKKIGNRLKDFRESANLTIRELAKNLNIDNSLITKYEKGLTLISTHVCYDIARKYNISVDWLLNKTEDKEI